MVIFSRVVRVVSALSALSICASTDDSCEAGADGVCKVQNSASTPHFDKKSFGVDEANRRYGDQTKVTDAWMEAVVAHSSPAGVAALFCEDGVLVSTARPGIRWQTRSEDGWGVEEPPGTTIESYFEWFAKLPDQNITNYHDNVVTIAENVWINNVWVNWTWDGNPGLTARMTFILRRASAKKGICIYELHSSQLPEKLEDPADFSSQQAGNGSDQDAAKILTGQAADAKKTDWKKQVASLTSEWMTAVVNESDPMKVTSLFCDDGILLPTAAKGLRLQRRSVDGWGEPKEEGFNIRSYFDWFVKLPGQAITKYQANFAKVNEDVWINNAWVNWVWDGNPGLVARMTFIIRPTPKGPCIIELHSSRVPNF
eukprot:TRINITY_DN384_c0_g1_i1.p1 TRINITY_DN384_c0_g1~~TRINITY_DN384_c0_g1_i1.p1  ORF type:complete len:370 (-),score=64.83 TRINITY_DN384_c0_g1_i1:447-1556(-)